MGPFEHHLEKAGKLGLTSQPRPKGKEVRSRERADRVVRSQGGGGLGRSQSHNCSGSLSRGEKYEGSGSQLSGTGKTLGPLPSSLGSQGWGVATGLGSSLLLNRGNNLCISLKAKLNASSLAEALQVFGCFLSETACSSNRSGSPIYREKGVGKGIHTCGGPVTYIHHLNDFSVEPCKTGVLWWPSG